MNDESHSAAADHAATVAQSVAEKVLSVAADDDNAAFQTQLAARFRREGCPAPEIEVRRRRDGGFSAAVWLNAGLRLVGSRRQHLWQFESFAHIRHHVQNQAYTHILLLELDKVNAATTEEAEEYAAYRAMAVLPPSRAKTTSGGARRAARTLRRQRSKTTTKRRSKKVIRRR